MTDGPLERRRAIALARLRDAVALDVARFLSTEVEARLRARPNFAARFAPQGLVAVRERLDAGAPDLVDQIVGALEDLEAWYRGVEPSDAEEAAAVTRIFEPAADLVRSLLKRYAFPGDQEPDPEVSPGVDLSPRYALAAEPSDAVLWAWRQLRGLDEAAHHAAAGRDSFAVRFHAPETLRF